METFVVRIFVPAEEEQLELTGIVEHSGTGRSEQFRGSEGLIHVVLHQLELGHETVGRDDDEDEKQR